MSDAPASSSSSASASSSSSRPAGPSEISGADLSDALEALRTQVPLVQCLTNIVVAGWSANVLLAAGAAPAMVDNPREAGVLGGVAGGVLVNLGTPYEETVEAMYAAARAARAGRRPWVLDPVAAGALPWRTEHAVALLDEQPTVVRGNASEVLALTGGAGGKGVDSTDSPESVLEAAQGLAERLGCVVAVSGAVDHVTDGRRLVRVHNGHEWLTKVTGVGCSLGALVAGYAAVADPLVAAAAATAHLTVAADAAAEIASGPGSFAVALLDQLERVTPEMLSERVRLS